MPGLQTGNFADMLKEFYIGPINDNTFKQHVLLNRLEKNTKDVSGVYAYIPIKSGRNPAVGGRREPSGTATTVGALLPQAGRQTYASATYPMVAQYARGAVSGQSSRRSRDAAGAFAKSLDTEMSGLMTSAPEDLNRQICGTGLGRAATLSSTQADSTVITVDSRDPMMMRVGDRVHVADITAGTGWRPTNGALVSSIAFNSAANMHAITLDTTTGDTATTGVDAFYFGANTAGVAAEDSSRGQDMEGLFSLIDDGSVGARLQDAGEAEERFFDINAARAAETVGSILLVGSIARTNAFWQANVRTNPDSAGTKRTVTEPILIETWLIVTAQHGAPAADVELYASPHTWGTVGMIQVGSRTYNDTQDTVKMGFAYIVIQGSKFFFDRDIMPGVIFYLNMKEIMLLHSGDYELMDDDGSPIRIAAGGTRDAWEFSLVRDTQLACSNMRSHAQLRDLTDTMAIDGQLH